MDKASIPISTLIDRYLSSCRSAGMSSKTIRGYNEKLRRYVRVVGGTLGDFMLEAVRGQSWKQRARVYDIIVEQLCLRPHETSGSRLSKNQEVVAILREIELFVSPHSSGNWRSLRRESRETCQSMRVSYGLHEVSEGRQR